MRDKTVFISGADGFIGSHLCELLVSQGCNVKAGVYYNSWGSVGWLQDLDDDVITKIKVVRFDIRDPGGLVDELDDVDIFFNLASLISIPYSYESPKSYFETNALGTLNILEIIRARNPDCLFVQMSTSEVYGSAQYVPIDEKHPQVAQSPYAASKIAADKIVESYARSFGVKCVIARAFNTYGPRQTARAVIPTILAKMLRGKEVSIGALEPKRDFCFVADTVKGIWNVANSGVISGEVINIGTGKSYSIREIVHYCSELTNFTGEVTLDASKIRPKSSEVDHLLCDATRLTELTGSLSTTNIEEGLARTANWIRVNIGYFDHVNDYS